MKKAMRASVIYFYVQGADEWRKLKYG